MHKGRLEAFSDGVIAIIVTIMVLDLKVPHGADVTALLPLIPVFLSYLLSFIFVGVYWLNHHHLLQAAKHVNGHILWANLHLLFWLSIVPFATDWMGQNPLAPWPVAAYGAVQLLAGFAYFLLSRTLVVHHGQDSALAKAIGRDIKGKLSVVAYVIAMPLAFVNPLFAYGVYVLVAVMWLVPDRRIERVIAL